MKTITFLKINIITAIFGILALLVLVSCQNEEIVLVDKPDENEKLTANVPFTGLLSRVTQNPTSNDNVLDRSSCVSVTLPVGVTINNVSFIANSYQQVQSAIDAVVNPNPQNTAVHMSFPIQVVGADYGLINIISQSQMDSTLSNCSVDTQLNEIDCIQIKYPISVAIYNTNSQRISTVTFNNNPNFYKFITKELTNDIIVNINYPLELNDTNNQKVTVKNNLELELLIRNAIEICD